MRQLHPVATDDHHHTNFPDLKPNPYRYERLRDQLGSRFSTEHWRSRVAVTFTLKQCVDINDVTVFLNQDICTTTFKRFMDRLNRLVYKNAFRHGRKRLQVLPMVKKPKKGRWLHALIEPPEHMSPTDFKDAVRRCWLWQSKTTPNIWAYRQMHICFWADERASDYLLKSEQKDGLQAWSDSIDWYSFNNPGSSSV